MRLCAMNRFGEFVEKETVKKNYSDKINGKPKLYFVFSILPPSKKKSKLWTSSFNFSEALDLKLYAIILG